MVIAASKPEVFAKQILEYFGIAHYFDVIAGASLDSSRIRKSDVITYALAQLDYDPQTTIMVGDREHDIQGAQANQLASIGVLYGYGNRQELEKAGATMIAESILDLKQLLI